MTWKLSGGGGGSERKYALNLFVGARTRIHTVFEFNNKNGSNIYFVFVIVHTQHSAAQHNTIRRTLLSIRLFDEVSKKASSCKRTQTEIRDGIINTRVYSEYIISIEYTYTVLYYGYTIQVYAVYLTLPAIHFEGTFIEFCIIIVIMFVCLSAL